MKHVALFIVTCLVASEVGWAQGLSKASDPQAGIPFELNPKFGSILIKAQVNGRPAKLIVDTGSSHTILSSDLLQIRPVALERADAPSKGSGYVGSAGWGKATLEVGTAKWSDRKVLVMNDFQEMSSTLQERVDGIIGADILLQFDTVIIDFKNRRLFLR